MAVGLHNMPAFGILMLQIVLIMQFTKTFQLIISKPGCPQKCGEISVPYPFGIGQACFLKGFEVYCDRTNDTSVLSFSNDEIMNIFINSGEVRVNNHISSQCDPSSGISYWNLSGSPFWFSKEKNKFTVIGCNTTAYLEIYDVEKGLFSVGCILGCYGLDSLANGSCSGIACCQTTIPKGTTQYRITFGDHVNNPIIDNISTCAYAVLMEDAGFEFNTRYITTNELHGGVMPLILDWTIANKTCEEAINNQSSYACVSKNSACVDVRNGNVGYLCNCSVGYEGNPYLEEGCQDIDECADKSICNGNCQNIPGSYLCYCPSGTHNITYTSGATGCEVKVKQRSALWSKLVIGSAMCICLASVIAVPAYMLHKMYKQKNTKVTRQNNFKRHYDIILQKHQDITERMTQFTTEELEKATNQFDETLVVGTGGHGKVYKGILSDKRVVAIKKPTKNNYRESEEFLNEAVILSQLNHRNVVKFFGCCLESEAPWLVYEFISNGTLTDHLHVHEGQSLSWNDRLRIALETAGSLSYLHSAASISVFHRDIKTSNILLSDGLVTKLSDFGASRSIPISANEANSTVVQGTFGYLDPEYYETGRLTAKSDVYSFGVILAELLTRKKPVFVGGGSLVIYFRETMRETCLQEILDPQIVDVENMTELQSVAVLAEMCFRSKGEERPTMKDVHMRLELIWSSKVRIVQHLNAQVEQQQPLIENQENEEHMSRVYSMEVELISSANFPR